MQMEGGRVRHEAAARAARLACAEGPPVGGTFQFQIFIQTPSPETWSETISGREEVLAGPVFGLPPWTKYRRRDRAHLARLTRDGCSSLSALRRRAILPGG